METDPLQQLRDVHLPSDPSWWPPAVGWWVVAIAVAAVLYWLGLRILQAHRARLPLKHARALLESYYVELEAGAMSPAQYAHTTNALIKRLLVRAHARMDYAKLTGDRWLAELDALSQSSQFTQGPGRVLGTERFAATANVDTQGLHRAVRQLLRALKPPGSAS